MKRSKAHEAAVGAAKAANQEATRWARATQALIAGRVHWSGWRSVGDTGGRDYRAKDQYRVGVFDATSPSGAKVLIGFRCKSTGQADSYDVLELELWRETLRNAGNAGAETFLLIELCGWAEAEARRVLREIAEATAV